MDKKFIFSLLFILLFSSNALAIELYARNLSPITEYDFTFNLTSNEDCSGVLLSHSETVNSTARGDYLFNIDIKSLTETPSYLCEYIDGVLTLNYSYSDIIFNSIRVKNITSDNIFTGTINSSNWSNVTINESQILDLQSYLLETDQRYNETNQIISINNSLSSIVEDNSSWNESYADTLYADISTVTDNATWSESYADGLYYSILNPYVFWNATYATFNKTYADTLYASISVISDNSSWNETYANTLYYSILNPYTYWNSTFAGFNKTYADTLYADISVVTDNSSWNESYADTLYADISVNPDNSSWNESYADTKYAVYNYGSNNFNGSGNITSGGLTINGNSLFSGNSRFNLSYTPGYCENESCTIQGTCEAPIFILGCCGSVWHDEVVEYINITDGNTELGFFTSSGGLHMNKGIGIGEFGHYALDGDGVSVYIDNENNGSENFNTGLRSILIHANSSNTLTGVSGQIYPSNRSTIMSNIYGLRFLVALGLTGYPVTPNATNIYGSKSDVTFGPKSDYGSVENVYGIYANVDGIGSSDATIVENVYGAYIRNVAGFLYDEKIANSFGLYIAGIGGGNNTYSIYTGSGRVRFGDNVSVNGNISASGYMFATDFLTGSKVADVNSKQSSLSKLDNMDKWLNKDGSINYSAHYAGTKVTIEDTSRPVIVQTTKTKPECENDPNIDSKYKTEEEYNKNCIYVENMTTYPYTKEKEALSMETRVAEMEKMIYELGQENDFLKVEICSKDKSYSWC